MCVFAITSILARRIVYEMLGWLLDILIDIPTHGFKLIREAVPAADFGYRLDDIALWMPWF